MAHRKNKTRRTGASQALSAPLAQADTSPTAETTPLRIPKHQHSLFRRHSRGSAPDTLSASRSVEKLRAAIKELQLAKKDSFFEQGYIADDEEEDTQPCFKR